MVQIHLKWFREHLIDFSKQITNKLLNDRVSDSFDITLHLETCNISIENGEVSDD